MPFTPPVQPNAIWLQAQLVQTEIALIRAATPEVRALYEDVRAAYRRSLKEALNDMEEVYEPA